MIDHDLPRPIPKPKPRPKGFGPWTCGHSHYAESPNVIAKQHVELQAFGIVAGEPTPSGHLYPADVLQSMLEDLAERHFALSVRIGRLNGADHAELARLVGFATEARFDGQRAYFTVSPPYSDDWSDLPVDLAIPGVMVAFDAIGKAKQGVYEDKPVQVVEHAKLECLIVVNQDGSELPLGARA